MNRESISPTSACKNGSCNIFSIVCDNFGTFSRVTVRSVQYASAKIVFAKITFAPILRTASRSITLSNFIYPNNIFCANTFAGFTRVPRGRDFLATLSSLLTSPSNERHGFVFPSPSDQRHLHYVSATERTA